MLEASKAGVQQAGQDGEQNYQEGEESGGGRQTWEHTRVVLRRALPAMLALLSKPGAQTVGDFQLPALPLTPTVRMVS